jgi:hypothetical protein
MTADPHKPLQQPDPLFSRRRSPNRPSATSIDPLLDTEEQVNQIGTPPATEMCECGRRNAKTGTHRHEALRIIADGRRLWVPVFACRETGMTPRGATASTVLFSVFSVAL